MKKTRQTDKQTPRPTREDPRGQGLNTGKRSKFSRSSKLAPYIPRKDIERVSVSACGWWWSESILREAKETQFHFYRYPNQYLWLDWVDVNVESEPLLIFMTRWVAHISVSISQSMSIYLSVYVSRSISLFIHSFIQPDSSKVRPEPNSFLGRIIKSS